VNDYLRARDALIAVREVPGGGELACQLFEQIDDVSQHLAMIATTIEAERLVKAYDPLQPRQPPGTEHGGEWTRLQHARGPFAPRRMPTLEIAPALRSEPLDTGEKHALTIWTGAKSHEIRSGYENGLPQTNLAKEFDSAIRKLPAESGTFYRGINVDLKARDMPGFQLDADGYDRATGRLPWEPVDDPAEVAVYWRAKIGHPLIWGQPSSSTPAREYMEKMSLGPGARTVFKIDTARAVKVSQFAMTREAWESERVIPPGQFEIAGVEVRDYPIVDAFAGRGGTESIATVTLRDTTKIP
jgi:hypothetical protein